VQEVFESIPASEHMEPSTTLNVDYQPAFNLEGCHVLIADDDMVNQLILKRILHQIFKAECDIVSDGQEVVDKVKEKGLNYYSAIIMDILMPKLTGTLSVLPNQSEENCQS